MLELRKKLGSLQEKAHKETNEAGKKALITVRRPHVLLSTCYQPTRMHVWSIGRCSLCVPQATQGPGHSLSNLSSHGCPQEAQIVGDEFLALEKFVNLNYMVSPSHSYNNGLRPAAAGYPSG